MYVLKEQAFWSHSSHKYLLQACTCQALPFVRLLHLGSPSMSSANAAAANTIVPWLAVFTSTKGRELLKMSWPLWRQLSDVRLSLIHEYLHKLYQGREHLPASHSPANQAYQLIQLPPRKWKLMRRKRTNRDSEYDKNRSWYYIYNHHSDKNFVDIVYWPFSVFAI